MHPAFEAVGGFGLQLLGCGGLADVGGIPGRPFQQYASGVLADLRLGPSDNPTDGERSGGVSDQHSEVIQLPLHSIQRGQPLPGLREAGDDRGRFAASALHQNVIVKSVQRFPNLPHRVVGGIHDVVDGPHAGQSKPPLHPVGAWPHLHFLD